MRSRQKNLLLYVASLGLGGALLGVQFGRSAVAEIDPGFYRLWDSYHSFSQYSGQGQRYAGEEAGIGVEPAGCADCALGTGRHPWLQHPVFSDADLGITQNIPAEAEYVADEPVILPAAEIELPAQPRNFERYAYYPVDANDAPVEEQKPQEVAAIDTPAAVCAADCVPVGM